MRREVIFELRIFHSVRAESGNLFLEHRYQPLLGSQGAAENGDCQQQHRPVRPQPLQPPS